MALEVRTMWPFRRKAQPAASAEPTGPVIAVVHHQGAAMQLMSVLSPQQQIEVGGLPREAIAGSISVPIERDTVIPAEAFHTNPAFVDFMQHVIRTFGPEDPGLQEAARQQGHGPIGIIDLRTPEGPEGNVPLEDIVGIFAVAEGKLGEYHANDKHVLFTRHGLVRLPPDLYRLHIRELMRLKVQAAEPPSTPRSGE